MSGFAVSGEGSEELITNAAHDAIDHTAAPFNLLDGSAHDAVDHTAPPFNLLTQALHDGLDHNLALNNNPAQVTPAERTAGSEGALRSFSPFDIASMAGIHGPGLQVSVQTLSWSGADSSAKATGAFGFTPTFAIVASAIRPTSLAGTGTISVGFTTGTSVVKGIAHVTDNNGSDNDDLIAYDTNDIAAVLETDRSVGGLATNFIAQTGNPVRFSVTAFGSGGITVTPSFKTAPEGLTGVMFLLVVGQ